VKVVGIDLGERRIGIAVSDSTGTIASPRWTVTRGLDADADRRRLVELVADAEASVVVVGLPLSLDGRKGPAARSAMEEAAALRELLAERGVEVLTFDERFTTVSAETKLAQAGLSGPGRRRVVDQAAAAVMLQAWLDSKPSLRQSDAGPRGDKAGPRGDTGAPRDPESAPRQRDA
jgi:putative Holliday junction resolvase